MNVNEFDFILDEKLIAQHPIEQRSNSKLLTLDKDSGKIEHEHFFEITKYFKKGEILVINETKVLPARLFGKKAITNANIEILLLKETKKDIWEVLIKPAKRIKVGDFIIFNDKLKAECIKIEEDGIRLLRMVYEGIFIEIIEDLGTMPLPPYITDTLEEQSRYQTVYAKNLGSAAAPTAGLHFTKEILEELKQKGVIIVPITLNVGLGTFRPVQVENLLEHVMHSEKYTISEDSAKILNQAIKENTKITAVGTTSMRTLEANYDDGFRKGSYETDIFIYPGYKFKAVDQLITNFHLPKSTLLMLVSAFSSKENIKKSYEEAIKNKYRFFSFGDAMFIKTK